MPFFTRRAPNGAYRQIQPAQLAIADGPIGFGLENFDWMGRWRENDANSKPVDASGELPSGGEDNYRARTLIREIVLSVPFRHTQGGVVHQDAASHNNQVKANNLPTK